MPLTVAAVPTGMKRGVSTTPWGVWKRPVRAWVWGQRCSSSNWNGAAVLTPQQRTLTLWRGAGWRQHPTADAQVVARSSRKLDLLHNAPLWPGVTPRFERIARFAPVIGVFIGGAQAPSGCWAANWGCPAPAAPCWCWPWGCGSRAVCTSTGQWTPAMACCRPPLPRRHGRQPHRRQRPGGWIDGAAAQTRRPAGPAALAPTLLIWSAVWGRSPRCWPSPGSPISGPRQWWLSPAEPSAPAARTAASSRCAGAADWPQPQPSGTRTVLAGLCGVIPTLLVPRLLGQRLGGHTGDSYGACVEWTEAFTLWSGWLMLRLLS